ncbi:MAG: biotin--[acetyl-CoA-carboxylase] ligase [Thermomicrobiales bacterium]|nr:biotin--[acetyl-CoA-carboxylase] ligase [Thermomicrobiales bacterium]MCO5221603.1 biotin--[acetyl-CoA-carboxylase] ligase [Thermomicrobiales bacterium]
MIRLGAVTSTMDIAARLLELGTPEGTAIVAQSQMAGRGRGGRTWQSPPGVGLYCSLVFRPLIAPDRFQPFSVMVGLALCEVLDPLEDAGIHLKWPNDLVIGERKLAGILVTASIQNATVERAVAGLGINLRCDPSGLSSAVSLEEMGRLPEIDDATLVAEIAEAVARRYDQLLGGNGDMALAGWEHRLADLGEQVIVRDGERQREGRLVGIEPSGAMLLDTSEGVLSIHMGELTRGPVKRT